MRVTISKTFDFDAAHWLPKVDPDHKCRRMHGHTYRAEIICEGEVGKSGMVIDYADIADAWAPLHDLLDHRVLNEVQFPPNTGSKLLENPTTEHLVYFIWALLTPTKLVSVLKRVRVYESSTTYCEYPPTP